MKTETKKPCKDSQALAGTKSIQGSAKKHGERIASYSDCKKRSVEMMNFLSDHDQFKEEHAHLSGCANYLVFHNYYTVDEIRLAKAQTCKKHMLCPFCARRRAAKQVGSYVEKFQQVMSENPSLKPVMLTLTVKNGEDLQERFDHLKKSFKKVQESIRDFRKKNRGFNEFCKIQGMAFSYEFTKNPKTDEWHPHIHAVCLLSEYVDIYKLSEYWLKVTGDSSIVDIRRLQGSNLDDMSNAFIEVFKYALKFSDLSLEDNVFAYRLLRGKRLQGSQGLFWGVKVPDSDLDDMLEGLPYLEMLYTYSFKKYAYDLKEINNKGSDEIPDGFDYFSDS